MNRNHVHAVWRAHMYPFLLRMPVVEFKSIDACIKSRSVTFNVTVKISLPRHAKANHLYSENANQLNANLLKSIPSLLTC